MLQIIPAEVGDLTPARELMQMINATADFYTADAPSWVRAEQAVLLLASPVHQRQLSAFWICCLHM